MLGKMTLVADSGSTKTSWLLRRAGYDDIRVETVGINPVRDSDSTIGTVVGGVAATLGSYLSVESDSLSHSLWRSKLDIFFYGAGCIEPFKSAVEDALRLSFAGSTIVVESDLLGAARALCGHSEGIACILGTGSNSCLYDGHEIIANIPPLGWILGDEGSGAVLGRRLVSDALKGELGDALRSSLLERFALSPTDIIDKVYRQPQPNRFLASLVPFLVEHRAEDCIQELIIDSFRSFFRRNVKKYGRDDLPVNFVGGIASQFSEELLQSAETEGLIVGRIERSPITLMAAFHD